MLIVCCFLFYVVKFLLPFLVLFDAFSVFFLVFFIFVFWSDFLLFICVCTQNTKFIYRQAPLTSTRTTRSSFLTTTRYANASDDETASVDESASVGSGGAGDDTKTSDA